MTKLWELIYLSLSMGPHLFITGSVTDRRQIVISMSWTFDSQWNKKKSWVPQKMFHTKGTMILDFPSTLMEIFFKRGGRREEEDIINLYIYKNLSKTHIFLCFLSGHLSWKLESAFLITCHLLSYVSEISL